MEESVQEVAPAAGTAAVVTAGAAQPVAPAACANCAAPVSGRYCSACGQRLDIHLHSVGEFFGEAGEVLTHADSRVWATLRPLVTRPGFLTREYIAGRRAAYLQPFRLYVVFSVLFFLLAALLGEHSQAKVEVLTPRAETLAECNDVHTDLPGAAWLTPRFAATCRDMATNGGQVFGEKIAHNMGRAMFVFLPLLAALMKLLYWRPRRYYLEHLLLLVHNHAFVFLALSIFMLAVHWIHSDGWIVLLSFGLAWYLGRYLYRSMKTVYGQHGLLTFAKFIVLSFAYLIGALFMLIATAFVSAIAV